MSHTNRRGTHRTIGILGAFGALLLQGSTALAATGPQVFKLADAIGGPEEQGENNGPGNEQAAVTAIEKDGKLYVVTVYMNSDVPNALAPGQGKCSSMMIDPMLGPQLVADKVYLTENENTDRPFNHPALTNDGENIWLTYGYAVNGVNTQTYARIINEMCQSVTETKRVSNNNNNNQGAPAVTPVSVGKALIGYYDNNNEVTYSRLVTIENGAIANGNLKVVINDSNIGRPEMATSGDRTLLCATKGQRPGDDGMACSYINSQTGDVLWKNEIIIASDLQSNPKRYYNQPAVALLGPGRFAVQAIESTGMGKNTDVKGGSDTHIFILEPNDQGPNVRTHASGIGEYRSHSSLIAGPFGEDGAPTVGLFEASIAASGPPMVTMLTYDAPSLAFKAAGNWIIGTGNADSGLLPNLTGQNPGTSGRDFLRGITGVKNPGAAVEGGWMNEVETFWVLPYAGNPTNHVMNYKNALYLSMVPGKTKVPVTPGAPADVPEDQFSGNTPQGTPGGNNPDQPAPGAEPPVAADPTPAPEALAPAPQAGGCSVSDGSSGSAGGLAALGLALAGLAAARRRKAS